MTKEQRIKQLEQDIERFDYLRMKKLESAQKAHAILQEELGEINNATLTRRGEIICLQRLIAEDEE